MRRLIIAISCALLAFGAQAQDKKKEPTEKQKAQQQKMKDCSKQAGDKKLKGDERKKYMSSCLSG